MAKVFNLGIGMVLVVAEADAAVTVDALRTAGHDARAIGRVEAGPRSVRLVGP
jgi:phosphoribosylformylglycinamidine cyclo-ligase